MTVTLALSTYRFSSCSKETSDFFCSKSIPRRSKSRIMATKSGPPKQKNKDRATLVKSPYANVEATPPELHKSFSDFLEDAKTFMGDDEEGPPRWFSPLECGTNKTPASPLLLYLPGVDGTGLGLIRHHKKLSEIFDIWCLHLPGKDRTPAKDLVKLIEKTVVSENNRFPTRPIYLVGESIGACLALDVAARNPNIDLSLILANPATYVSNLMFQSLSAMLNVLPEDTYGFKQGDSLNATLAALLNEVAFRGMDGQMLRDLFSFSTNLTTLSRIFSKDTLLWKLELLRSAIASAYSHIHAVRAKTLILLSGHDHWLLKEADINRISRTLPNCIVRKLKDSGQFLFFEDGVDLVTILKWTCFYRRGRNHDYVSDFIMPTKFEIKKQLEEHRLLIEVTSPVWLSTLQDGTIVRSLEGLPSEGPVLYVGYHMLLGFELGPMFAQFLKERNILLRGLVHPMIFTNNKDTVFDIIDPQLFDKYKIMGGVPVSHNNIFKLLRLKSHVLLYPGGIREGLHRKGEAYKLFWSQESEFVRVASKFGATIVPFGVVGEDDICEIVLDSNDQKNIPILKNLMERASKEDGTLRDGDLVWHFPGLVPKIPGRFYYYFGKPIETAGKEQELREKENAQELYVQVKSEVERCIAYLKMKRESDPYRNLLARMLYKLSHGSSSEIPTFDI